MSDNKIQVGLKETKEVIDFGASLAKAVNASLENDNKITFDEVFNFLPVLYTIRPAIEGVDLVPLEFRLVNQEEADDLKAYVKSKFDIADDKIEQFIEDCFAIVLDLWIVIKRYVLKDENPSDATTPNEPVA